MDLPSNALQLHDALTRECDMVMTLVDVLSDERSCLIHLDSQRLVELALRKEALMLELEQRSTERLQMARDMGFSADKNGLTQCMERLSHHDERIGLLFQTFQQTVTQAQRLNDLNGALVAEQLTSLHTRIQILTEATRPISQVYGPDGIYGQPNGALSPGVVAR
ncbi:MAG: flagella synthesis protein FlgN [Burkholderiaceae bacterium]|jgi:flagellar biosynthesis/type III secretory pathway chaperone